MTEVLKSVMSKKMGVFKGKLYVSVIFPKHTVTVDSIPSNLNMPSSFD